MAGEVALAALALAGCGSGSGTTSNSANVKGGTEGGGTITAGVAYSGQDFDPATTSSALALGTNWQVVEGLYGLNRHDYSTFYELAASDPVQTAEATYEVSLREDAKFSDGSSVGADDVVSSFERAAAQGGPYAPMLAPIASVQKRDDATVVVTTTVPNFSLLKERLSIVRVTPADASADDMSQKPVGSGPWMYDSISDTAIDLVPNPNYNGGHPASDQKIHYEVLKDASARATAQQEGNTLVMEMVTDDAISQLENSGCSIDTVWGFATRFLMFNVRKSPWDNRLVRQAVMYALDTGRMISDDFAGLAEVPLGFLPQAHPNFHQASTVYQHDAQKAQDLLGQSGVTPGDVSLLTTDNEQVMAMASQVKTDLESLGFSVSVTTDVATSTYDDIDGGGDYDLLLAPGDPSCFGNDPDLLMRWWYGDDVWMQTRCPWGSSAECQQLRALMDQALAQSGDQQQQTWNACFDILADNAVLYPVLHVPTTTASWRDNPSPSGTKLKGFQGIGATGLGLLDVTTVSA